MIAEMQRPNDSLYSLSEFPEIGVPSRVWSNITFPGAVAQHTADISDQCQDRGRESLGGSMPKEQKITKAQELPEKQMRLCIVTVHCCILSFHRFWRITSQVVTRLSPSPRSPIDWPNSSGDFLPHLFPGSQGVFSDRSRGNDFES